MSVVILLLTGDIFSLSCFLKARQETRTSHQQDLNNHHFLSSEETEQKARFSEPASRHRVTQVFSVFEASLFSRALPREKVWAQTFLWVSYWRHQAKASSCWCHIHSQ